MLSFYNKIMKFKPSHPSSENNNQNKEESHTDLLKTSLQENIQNVMYMLGNSDDIMIREIHIGTEGTIKAGILYTDGLVDSQAFQNFIMESLMIDFRNAGEDELVSSCQQNVLSILKDRILAVGDIRDVESLDSLLSSLLSGDVILLLDGYAQGFAIGMRGWKDRGVTESTTESVVRGPKESFSESLRTSTALLRRKIKDPNLWLESKSIGRVTKTDVAIMYIKGIANDKIVEEVRSRLVRIDIDGILESGYIEELIQDATYTPFPTVIHSERPDVIAAGLLEGKVAILTDGTPIVLIVPVQFVSFMQAAEDYYQRADIATLVRLLRYLALFIALLGPSLYIAIITFHQEMLPTPLLISLAAQREGVPFPAFIEASMMEVTFEILREAGLRMPKAVGQAISIVGTLVIGTAAVEAGIVSAAMVIVVAITAISSFVFPNTSMSIAIRILRFPLMLLSASFGLFGTIIGIIAIVLHLCSLRSFGVPYMSPVAPMILKDQKDAIFRFPRPALLTRPGLISQKNVIREQSEPQAPQSRHGESGG